MKTIVLYNFKGGCFKSTGTIHLAAGLAVRGKKVLIIDTDPQAHATRMAGLRPSPALYDLLVRDASLKDVIRAIPSEQYTPDGMTNNGSLFVIGSNEEARTIPMQMDDPLALRERLEALDGVIDIVVIDTPPTPSLLSIVIYMAADYALYPTKCEVMHFDGLRQALVHRERAQHLRIGRNLGDIHVLGILPVMYRGKTQEHSEQRQLLIEQYGSLVWSPITDSIVWAEASRHRSPVFKYAPDSAAAKQAWGLVGEVEGRVS